MFKIERYFYGSQNEFRQQVWGLVIFPYCYLAVLKISRESGADSCSTYLVSLSLVKLDLVKCLFIFAQMRADFYGGVIRTKF